MLNFPITTFCIFSTKGDVIIRVCGIFSTLTFITKSYPKVLNVNFELLNKDNLLSWSLHSTRSIVKESGKESWSEKHGRKDGASYGSWSVVFDQAVISGTKYILQV